MSCRTIDEEDTDRVAQTQQGKKGVCQQRLQWCDVHTVMFSGGGSWSSTRELPDHHHWATL